MRAVLAFLVLVTAMAMAPMGIEAASAKEQHCRMVQQCHWVNFKKVCTWVKVCR
jgi:hypothetical protein